MKDTTGKPKSKLCPRMRQAARGFTLLELMLVVSIIGILTALAIGTTKSAFQAQKLKEVARGVQSAIAMGRAEAVRLSTSMTVTVSGNRIYVFKDADNDGSFGAGETCIYQYPAQNLAALPANIVLSSTALSVGGISRQPGVVFNYAGLSVGANGLRSGTVCVADTSQNQVQAVQMTVAGACRIVQQAAAKTLCP